MLSEVHRCSVVPAVTTVIKRARAIGSRGRLGPMANQGLGGWRSFDHLVTRLMAGGMTKFDAIRKATEMSKAKVEAARRAALKSAKNERGAR